ncbi:hypothetical protein [Desulfolithobacter sp.]
MTEKKQMKSSGSGTLSGGEMDTSSVLEGAEPWEPVETKLVVGSLIAAAIALVVGLMLVPSSVLH